jgi:hypothetical protein
VSRRDVRFCEKDGFPKVRIHGRWECVAEYLERCIGDQEVVDVVQRGDTVWYVFENGHELPMLCFCCGEPLTFTDLEGARQDMKGRRLQDMSAAPGVLDDGTEMVQFRLHYAGKAPSSEPISDAISIQAAARMRHPPDCPYGRTAASSARRTRRRRKRR